MGKLNFESMGLGLARVTVSGCPVGRAGASGSGWHIGEVPVARTEGFFLAGFAGWFVGAVCWPGVNAYLNVSVKGLPALACAPGFSCEKRDPQGLASHMTGVLEPAGPVGPSGALDPTTWGTQRGSRECLRERENHSYHVIQPQPLSGKFSLVCHQSTHN